MNFRNYLGLLAIMLICVGCPNDDDDDEPDVVPVADRGEQSIEDDAVIQEYLQTHFYNYEEFEEGDDDFDYIVRIDTISGDNSDKIPIIDRPELDVITYDRFDASNTLYVLRARVGGDEEAQAANYTDSVFMDFRGVNLEDGSAFDGTANPIWLNLPATIDGFSRGLEGFKGDPDGVTVNDDGTSSYEDFGSGAVFIPSGLAYFNQPPPGIDIYGSVIFTFQTYNVVVTDHDGDKILSIDEDVTNNKFLFDDDDNTDGDAAFNFRDPDDDNDGVQSRLEIVTEGEGDDEVFVSFLDTDGDGTPNHLDTDDDGDGRETIEEISFNQATGEITFPDADDDGTPDYLDADS